MNEVMDVLTGTSSKLVGDLTTYHLVRAWAAELVLGVTFVVTALVGRACGKRMDDSEGAWTATIFSIVIAGVLFIALVLQTISLAGAVANPVAHAIMQMGQ